MAHMGGRKAHQTPLEVIEFEGRVALSNSSIFKTCVGIGLVLKKNFKK